MGTLIVAWALGLFIWAVIVNYYESDSEAVLILVLVGVLAWPFFILFILAAIIAELLKRMFGKN